ncbi:2', 3'cyclic nucleotide phosphodiesterase SpdA [Gellertiella hungarica]|uniref:3',5'-cyclic AMP phosphodiesterase CpdA n=1 Tax=Gellertiella hungarica TaxID=1572859 RepID=A0A7W6NJV2_9HYPH|nr:phosphodiesterase [Gellertiella hungarica]MBB4063864.1 3',5'-cyclic AMP phosphodiesterase CpdA [Gellertiella hungarica]
MAKLLVFTDLHMLPEGKTIIGLDPVQRFSAGLAHALRLHPDADRLIITGDLTHHGDRESYLRLKALLDGLPVPVSITIGNHDERETFLSVFSQAARDENGFVQETVDLPDARLVILDTYIPTRRGEADYASGLLCEKRLDWLDRQLLDAGERPVLIFMHHPPHDTGFKGMDAIKLRNGDAFYDLVGRHGNVRHLFAGHVHRTIGGSHRGIPFSIFKSPLHQQPMPFDIDDTSSSVDEPGAYGIVVTTPHGLQVHTEDFEIAARARTALDRAEGGLSG